MRIDLVTPFAEKEEAKALGARWDAAKRIWYIVDVEDLTPFLRWIPKSGKTPATPVVGVKRKPSTSKPPSRKSDESNKFTELALAVHVPHCGCDVLAWEHCKHTENTRSLKAIQPS